MDRYNSGQYFDAETGLYYNHHRYYAPELGRYLQPDRLVGEPNPAARVRGNGGLLGRLLPLPGFLEALDAFRAEPGRIQPHIPQRYGYADANPLSLTDPTGQSAAGAITIGGLALGGACSIYAVEHASELYPATVPNFDKKKHCYVSRSKRVVSRSWWKREKASFSGELTHNSRPPDSGGRRMTPWEAIAGLE